jgi:hypothetical protein
MSGALQRNWRRLRVMFISRAYKGLFLENGLVRRDGEAVLADLRGFCRGDRSSFDKDALTMARFEGRREVFLRVVKLLALDEDEVRQFMEADDGLGG